MTVRAEVIDGPIVSGTAVHVRTTVQNDSSQPIALPRAQTTSPLVFVVRDASGREVAAGNPADAMASRLGMPGPPPPTQPLAPGAQVVYEEDISSYLGRPLAAGKYQLVVTLRQAGESVPSGPVPLEVVTLAPEAVARAGDAAGRRLVTVVAHHADGNRHTLLAGMSDAAGTSNGTLRPVSRSNAAFTGVAAALSAEPDNAETWIAGLDASGLRGGQITAWDAGPSFGPIALPVHDARLFVTGIPLAGGGAAFVALGTDAKAAIVHVDQNGKTHVETASVSADVKPGLACLVADLTGADPRLSLCWVQNEKEIWAVALTGSGAGTPRRVFQGAGRIVALESVPPAAGSHARLSAITLLPTGLEGRANFVSIALGEPDVVIPKELPHLEAATGAKAAWLLPTSGASPSGPVLVTSGDDAWVLRDDVWSRRPLSGKPDERFQLVPFGDRGLWLSRWTPGQGMTLDPLSN